MNEVDDNKIAKYVKVRSAVVVVQSKIDVWQTTGMTVKPEELVVIHATKQGDAAQKWDIGWGLPCDARGYAKNDISVSTSVPPLLPVYRKGEVSVDYHWGALIASIGKNSVELEAEDNQFEVGLSYQGVSKKEGKIYLLCNDMRVNDLKKGFGDNDGSIEVEVSVFSWHI